MWTFNNLFVTSSSYTLVRNKLLKWNRLYCHRSLYLTQTVIFDVTEIHTEKYLSLFSSLFNMTHSCDLSFYKTQNISSFYVIQPFLSLNSDELVVVRSFVVHHIQITLNIMAVFNWGSKLKSRLLKNKAETTIEKGIT